MKTVSDKHVVIGADFGGFPLKEAVKAHLIERGWHVTDLTPEQDESPMYHRVGFMLGAQLAEGHFERALAFDGSGMGIHIAASKCPGVQAAVCESVESARRASIASAANLLAMGTFFVAPQIAMVMADAFLENSFGQGYEDWEGYYEFHKIGVDEVENFDYEAYKDNGFEVPNPGFAMIAPPPPGVAF